MRLFDRSRVEALCGPTRVYHIVSEIIPWLIFFLTGILLFIFRDRIPEQIPTNTDFRGNVTDWSDKSSLIWLGVVYAIINFSLWIMGFFPQTWNNGVRVGGIGLRRQNKVKSYPLTRDMLCDLRISMSLVFSGLLLWTAFAQGQYSFLVFGLVTVCVLVPLVRYFVRLALRR